MEHQLYILQPHMSKPHEKHKSIYVLKLCHDCANEQSTSSQSVRKNQYHTGHYSIYIVVKQKASINWVGIPVPYTPDNKVPLLKTKIPETGRG